MFTLVQISSKKYPKLKEVDDVLGGKEAWENVDSTEGLLFGKLIVYYLVIQGSKCGKICDAQLSHLFPNPPKAVAGC